MSTEFQVESWTRMAVSVNGRGVVLLQIQIIMVVILPYFSKQGTTEE
jgi:hypothetical protein